MNVQLRWFGFAVTRFSRIPGGPLVWNVLFRIGRRKKLEITYR